MLRLLQCSGRQDSPSRSAKAVNVCWVTSWSRRRLEARDTAVKSHRDIRSLRWTGRFSCKGLNVWRDLLKKCCAKHTQIFNHLRVQIWESETSRTQFEWVEVVFTLFRLFMLLCTEHMGEFLTICTFYSQPRSCFYICKHSLLIRCTQEGMKEKSESEFFAKKMT